jgi:hypothetical protein
MRLVSRFHAVRRGLVCLAVIAGVVFIPKETFAQG